MSSPRLQTLRDQGLVVVLVAAMVFFAAFTHRFTSIHDWLFWRFAAYWIVILCWAASCLSLGYAVLQRFFRGTMAKSEQLTLGFAIGVLAFGMAIFVVGLAHGLGRVTFVALPALFFAVGFKALRHDLRKLRARLRLTPSVTMPLWVLPVLGLGALGVGILYFQILSPETYSFDARWYHIPLGQRYAMSGKVAPFPEGFWQAAWPHLTSYLYAWAFMLPAGMLFDRVELCAHVEFILFLATLAQIPVLVRRVVPGARASLSWIALLAFPGIYLYDGNLNVGADHTSAFWAIPIALSFIRAWRSFRPANTFLFAAFLSAAALTKYSAITIILPFALPFAGRAAWLLARRRDATTARAVGMFLLGCFGLTAMHWLKNWIWYGDPVYPMLRAHLKIHPWVPDTVTQLNLYLGMSRTGQVTPKGLLEGIAATFNFSFIPNDWEFFHHDVPVFGSLFTLSLACLPFLREGRRLLWLCATTMGGIFCWYMISHYDRYLHAVVPLMAAATAAILTLAWRTGRLARAGVTGLFALQVIWAGDVPFIATHNLLGDSPVHRVEKFLASAFEKVPHRLRIYEPLSTVGRAVPPDATLLAHDVIMILGLDRNWVTDLHQCRISYGVLRNPAAIDDTLKAVGATHLVWPGQTLGRDTMAGEIAFMNYAMNYAADRTEVEGFRVARLPAKRPADGKDDYDVAYFGCGQPYAKGWYHLSQLTVPVIDAGAIPAPLRPIVDAAEATRTADFIVVDSCEKLAAPAGFVMGARRGDTQLWARHRSGPELVNSASAGPAAGGGAASTTTP